MPALQCYSQHHIRHSKMGALSALCAQSWWEFAVNHAAHCYNRTPMSHLKWQTPYYLLNNEIPDISHLRVFGCSAYVHIPEARQVNKLSPKSELMIYLGRGSGMKANVFMRTPNTLFYSDKALFDERLFPKCPSGQSKGKPNGVTQLYKPASKELPLEDDTTPGDEDYTPPEPPIGGSAPQPAGAGPPSFSGGSGPPQTLPSPPDPVPGPSQPRRSLRVRKLLTCPENVYGERPPTTIICDIVQTRTWQHLTGDQPVSSQLCSCQDQRMSGEIPKQNDPDPPSAESENLHTSEDKVDQQLLTCLAQEGGVKFLDLLLAKAVPLVDLESPDTSNIREWTFRDIF